MGVAELVGIENVGEGGPGGPGGAGDDVAVNLAGLRGVLVELPLEHGCAWPVGLRLEDDSAIPLPSGTRLRIEEGPLPTDGALRGTLERVRNTWTVVCSEGYWNSPAALFGRTAVIV